MHVIKANITISRSYMYKLYVQRLWFLFTHLVLFPFLFQVESLLSILTSSQLNIFFYFNTDDFIKSWNLLWRHTNSSKRPWVEFQLEFKSCRKDTWEPSEGRRCLIHCHCHLSWLCISFNSGSSLWEENSIYAICDTKNWS